LKPHAEPGRKGPSGRRKAGLLRFAVLVPHRDSRRLVTACRPSLFAAGLPGAWSFPAVAPLARLSRPLAASELKTLAAFLREATLGRGGWITAGEPADIPSPGSDGGLEGPLRFWGPVLDLPVPAWRDIRASESAQPETVYCPFPAAVLCFALTPGGVPPSLPLPALPALSFRAAAAAAMTIRPLAAGAQGYSFHWKIGPLFWLPKKPPRSRRST
jgi:hypothetical protein